MLLAVMQCARNFNQSTSLIITFENDSHSATWRLRSAAPSFSSSVSVKRMLYAHGHFLELRLYTTTPLVAASFVALFEEAIMSKYFDDH